MLNKRIAVFFIISLAAGIFFTCAGGAWELFFLDLRFRIAGTAISTYDFSSFLVLITIDQDSEKRMGLALEGKGWRQYDALLLDFLTRQGAAVIVSDIQYSHAATPWDRDLALSFRRAGRVVVAEESVGITSPVFRENVFSVASPAITTFNGVPRKVYRFPQGGEKEAVTLPYAAAAAYADFLASSPSGMEEGEALNRRLSVLPDFWINYSYPVTYLPCFSYADVLAARESGVIGPGEVPVAIFKDKVVLLAKDFSKDRFPLPRGSGEKYFGGLAQAYGIETLLGGSYLRRAPLFLDWLLLAGVLLAMQAVLLKAPVRIQGGAALLLLVLYWIVICLAFRSHHIWFNYSGFCCGSLMLGFFHFLYRRRLLARNYRRVKKEISRLEEYNHLLEDAAEKRDFLTDTIVHDIKNAIAAVEGSLMYVSEKYKNDEYTLQTFHAANVACQDIINLSSNLLDLRKMEEGEMEFENRICTSGDILELADRFSQYPLFFEKKIELVLEPPPSSLGFFADQYLLEQVIHNLLNNALKYTPRGGKIKLTFSLREEQVVVSLFNTGRRITENQQQIIFDKYMRIGKGRSQYSKGLGLYFCRMAMEMQAGSIWLTTRAEGNVFHLGFKTAN